MGPRLARCGPLVASLAGHVALLAGVAGVASLAGSPAAPPPAVLPVGRVPDPGAAGAPRLQLATAGADEPAGAETVVQLDSADPRYRPYLAGVKRRIWERWAWPGPAAGSPERRTLVVEFTLTRSGALARSGVLEPSGTPALDRAALEAVARAVPFGPLPDSIAGDALRVRARFTYD